MARTTQRRESERWPAADPDDRWDASAEGRWDDEPDERWSEPPARRRQGRLRLEVPPIVNPYAIVSLASSLLGLFPVAIVFGFISFSHPRGRVMALFGLLLGFAELTAVAGFVLIAGNFLPDVARPDFLASTTTTSTVATSTPSTVEQAPAQPTAAVPLPTAPTERAEVKKGVACTEAGQIGAASDGATLLCLSGAGGKQWAGPYTVASTVEQPGTKCEGGAAKTARTSDGRAMVCDASGHTWVLWTE